MSHFSKESIEFLSDGITLRGEIFIPLRKSPQPAVLLTHGWGMTAGGNLTDYAREISESGMVAMTIDFRNLGKSDGSVRQDINPYEQIEDIRNAITFLSVRSEVDSERIGIWGSSFSGGHVLVVAAVDDRVKCVVSQVPTIHGQKASRLRLSAEALVEQQKRFAHDRQRMMHGEEPAVIKTVSEDSGEPVLYPGADSYTYMYGDSLRSPTWRNFCTLRSVERARAYLPGTYISEISPKPLLMIIADEDVVCPTKLQLEAFEEAGEPKELVVISGGHYAPYDESFDVASAAACDWFKKHL